MIVILSTPSLGITFDYYRHDSEGNVEYYFQLPLSGSHPPALIEFIDVDEADGSAIRMLRYSNVSPRDVIADLYILNERSWDITYEGAFAAALIAYAAIAKFIRYVEGDNDAKNFQFLHRIPRGSLTRSRSCCDASTFNSFTGFHSFFQSRLSFVVWKPFNSFTGFHKFVS